MNIKEVKGIDLGNVDVDETYDFAICTEKDLETRYRCGECEELHTDKDDAEACCKDE